MMSIVFVLSAVVGNCDIAQSYRKRDGTGMWRHLVDDCLHVLMGFLVARTIYVYNVRLDCSSSGMFSVRKLGLV